MTRRPGVRGQSAPPLAKLADDGLVKTKPQSHTRVTAIEPADVRDAAAAVVRAMHELADRTAVPRLTAERLNAMTRHASRMSPHWTQCAWPRAPSDIIVYEGKSMAGLIDMASRGEISRGSTVLYAHLGGQPYSTATARSSPEHPVPVTCCGTVPARR